MNLLKIISILFVLFVMTLCLTTTTWATVTIGPADPDILYTGRWADPGSAQPWSYWIGSSIILNFEGTSLTVTIKGGYQNNPDYLRIIIDNDAASSTKIAVGTTTATYPLATGLEDTTHKIEIIKETDVGYWYFYGLELDDNRTLLAPSPRPARRITFFGDSNLAGSSLESEENDSAAHLRGTYYGYAGIVSRMFDAEYHNISRSGAGISDINGVYDHINYWSANPLWDPALFEPDLIVVGLGANDVGDAVETIKAAYHAFLNDLRADYANAHIMLYNGWGWDYNEPANYTAEVIAEHGDPNMSSAIFPWVFEQWHGCEYDHAGMAQILANHLSSELGWIPGPRDVMNGFGVEGNFANGGFEERAPFGGYGWRYFTANDVSRVHDPSGAIEGEYYLRLANGAASHQPIPAVNGDLFTLSVTMRATAPGGEAHITIDFRDQKMWTDPLQTVTETKILASDWQQYSMTTTAPTGDVNPVFHTRITITAGAGDTIDIDDIAMSTPAAVDYGDQTLDLNNLFVSPNPFSLNTKIDYHLSTPGQVQISVHDVSGRFVTTLVDDHFQAGQFVASWNGCDESERSVGSGI